MVAGQLRQGRGYVVEAAGARLYGRRLLSRILAKLARRTEVFSCKSNSNLDQCSVKLAHFEREWGRSQQAPQAVRKRRLCMRMLAACERLHACCDAYTWRTIPAGLLEAISARP